MAHDQEDGLENDGRKSDLCPRSYITSGASIPPLPDAAIS